MINVLCVTKKNDELNEKQENTKQHLLRNLKKSQWLLATWSNALPLAACRPSLLQKSRVGNRVEGWDRGYSGSVGGFPRHGQEQLIGWA